MIKPFFIIASLLVTYSTVNAQDCDALKAENARLRFELAKFKGDALMGKADAMLGQSQTAEGITFKVMSATGDKKSQTVTVVLLITNHAANKEGFNTAIKSFTSADGEEFPLKSGVIGNSSGNRTLSTDAPIQGKYIFGGILPKTTMIKLLPVPFQAIVRGYEMYRVEFRDIAIIWK